MPPVINFKICDNCADCNGIKVCPIKAIYWDDINRTISIDYSKCINCGLCKDCCTNNAIRFAKSEEEMLQIKQEIENDPRKIADLFVERYGAMPVDNQYTFDFSHKKLRDRTISARPCIVEFNLEDNIECLLKSIPIKEIIFAFDENATYSKFIITKKQGEELGLKTFPCLLFYEKGKLINKILGYYNEKSKQELFNLIKNHSA